MLAKWCELTSCNGIIDLYEARNHKKTRFVFWSIIVTVMAIASVFFTYKAIKGYIDTPVVTNLETVANSTLDLPDILLCYNGGLNVSALNDSGFSDAFIELISTNVNGFLDRNVNATTIESAKQELNIFMEQQNISSLKAIYDQFSYRCEDLVVFLDVKNWSCKNENVLKVVTTRGSCYAFKNNGFQWYPGNKGGVHLKLKTPATSFVSNNPSKVSALLNNDFGLGVEKSVSQEMSFRYVLIPINSNVQITLNPMFYKRYPDPSKCNDRESTSSTCFYNCWAQTVYSNNKCIPLDQFGNNPNESLICSPFQNFDNQVNLQQDQICISKCLPKCNEWIFETMVSSSWLDSSFTNEKFSTVAIFYNVMQYTKIEEVPTFTYDVAIANVGGQCGLWLGMSVVTIIQAVYYFILYLCEKSKNENNERIAMENVHNSDKMSKKK